MVAASSSEAWRQSSRTGPDRATWNVLGTLSLRFSDSRSSRLWRRGPIPESGSLRRTSPSRKTVTIPRAGSTST